jgi:alpha-ribazole phosphatase
MSDIYLIRHTTPAVSKGVCYGQSDLDVTDSFYTEAAVIKMHLPEGIRQVYSSPLIRCRKLAAHLFPENGIIFHNELMEIHCGQWEMRPWNEIPAAETDPWMNDFVRICIPGGESYIDLYERVVGCFSQILSAGIPAAIVTHGGVIRSILSYITQTPLHDSFSTFSLHYGCVVRINDNNNGLEHTILSNIAPPEKEQHKPR